MERVVPYLHFDCKDDAQTHRSLIETLLLFCKGGTRLTNAQCVREGVGLRDAYCSAARQVQTVRASVRRGSVNIDILAALHTFATTIDGIATRSHLRPETVLERLHPIASPDAEEEAPATAVYAQSAFFARVERELSPGQTMPWPPTRFRRVLVRLFDTEHLVELLANPDEIYSVCYYERTPTGAYTTSEHVWHQERSFQSFCLSVLAPLALGQYALNGERHRGIAVALAWSTECANDEWNEAEDEWDRRLEALLGAILVDQ